LQSHGFRSQVLFKALKGEVWDEWIEVYKETLWLPKSLFVYFAC
jgi:hypothetical protein